MRAEAEKILRRGGVIPALPLVLNEDRSFDEAGQRRLVRYYLSAGASGLAVAVHTTQFEIRQPEVGLFSRLIKVARDEITQFERTQGKTILCICGVCGPVEQACAEAQQAYTLGYHAVLLSPGGLPNLDETGHITRAQAVADILPVVGFYLQSSVGGRRFTLDYWRRLCSIPGVVAVKAAPFNRYGTLDVVRAARESGRGDTLTLYTGNDDNIVLDLITTFQFDDQQTDGVHFAGGLLGHWAVWTHTAVQMYEELRSVRESGVIPAKLLTLAAQVTDCNSAFFDTAHNFAGCITGIHEVLRRQGLMKGIWTLKPSETLSDGQAQEITRVWESYPHLNDDAFVQQFLQAEGAQDGD